MLRGMIVVLAALCLILSAAIAGEKGEEGFMSKMKKLLPGEKEQAGAQKQGEGMMEKMKKMMPGEKEQAGAQKQGEGMMEKMKKIIPGMEKK
jgi:hypothetical protein